MSRKGKIPITLAKDVKINIQTGHVLVEGPKGKVDLSVPQGIKIEQKEGQLHISRLNDTKQDRANHGTIRSRLAQNIIGVTKGHKRDLEIQGIGFRANLQGKKILFILGYSHPVEFECPEGIKATLPSQTAISIEGADNVLVGETAAQIRGLKPVEPYKGKGIRYVGEFVRRKQGKSVAKE